ncbi:MAG: MFS transporter [Gammaproteobacteria bacterium]|nr:MFS transporter [Gammaproteobacteria bacterium]
MNQRPGSVEVPYGWVIVIVSLIINSIALAAPNILFVALKPIALEFDWPRAVPSMAYSLLMVGAGVGGIGMGMWLDRRGVMQPVMFGSVMLGLGALIASRSDGQWSLYVANGLLIGLLGKAAMIAPLVANATRWFDRRRGLAIAIIASGQGLSGALWPPIIGYLIDTVGWRGTYGYYGLFCIMTMVPLALLLRPRPPIAPAGSAWEVQSFDGRVLGWSPAAVQGILWFAVVGCCTGMAMPIVHLISYATDLGFHPLQASKMLSVLFAAAFISRIGYGMLADRIGGTRTLLFGSACQAVMLLVFAVVQSELGLYVAALMFGLGFAGIMPCYPLLIRMLFPTNQAGWRIASQYLFASMGMALGGWMGGAIFDASGSYRYAFLVGFGFNVMNFTLIMTLHLRQHRFRMTPLPA